MAESKEQALFSLSEILNIDRELARYYLERTRWSLEGAINEYYSDTSENSEGKKASADKVRTNDQFVNDKKAYIGIKYVNLLTEAILIH